MCNRQRVATLHLLTTHACHNHTTLLPFMEGWLLGYVLYFKRSKSSLRHFESKGARGDSLFLCVVKSQKGTKRRGATPVPGQPLRDSPAPLRQSSALRVPAPCVPCGPSVTGPRATHCNSHTCIGICMWPTTASIYVTRRRAAVTQRDATRHGSPLPHVESHSSRGRSRRCCILQQLVSLGIRSCPW